jgi:AraC-like DNA-binding protein
VRFNRQVTERSLSIRLLRPFARVTAGDATLLLALQRSGVGPDELGDPETRLPHRAVMTLLQELVSAKNDPSIGLRAGSSVEPGDFDALEYAARSCADFRGAIGCQSRYMRVLNEAAQTDLREEGDRATWEFRIVDGVQQVPAANDFVVACAITFSRMYADGFPEHPREVHLMHLDATDPGGYARVFGPNVKLGMPHNACVFDRRLLNLPMRRADPTVSMEFEALTRALAERLRVQQGVAARVRELVFSRLRSRQSGMASVGSAMGVSVATLRRRLAEEGTTHSEILDGVRRDLAMLYLCDSRMPIREIAFLLGYAQSNAFLNAFRRWTAGMAPADYRAQHRKV